MQDQIDKPCPITNVSMKSGLEGRNNSGTANPVVFTDTTVSMKSGLEGRNNAGIKPGERLESVLSQ